MTATVLESLDEGRCGIDARLVQAREMLARQDVDDETKLRVICALFAQTRVLVLF